MTTATFLVGCPMEELALRFLRLVGAEAEDIEVLGVSVEGDDDDDDDEVVVVVVVVEFGVGMASRVGLLPREATFEAGWASVTRGVEAAAHAGVAEPDSS
jgi:hypothetical protein